MIKPKDVIYPEGGEPLYEVPGSGERLTAQDFAASYGYESTQAFLVANEEGITAKRFPYQFESKGQQTETTEGDEMNG